jgi:tRNA nucleotidyltransferase/poly(A) polymerase
MTTPPKADSLRDLAAGIVRRLQEAGFAAFWVGGCVRDFLLGRTPGDYDIATSALPEQIEQTFKRINFRSPLFAPKATTRTDAVRGR